MTSLNFTSQPWVLGLGEGLSFNLNYFCRKRAACFKSCISGKFYLQSGTPKLERKTKKIFPKIRSGILSSKLGSKYFDLYNFCDIICTRFHKTFVREG